MSLPFTMKQIRKVTFYKRDEFTTDLICCDVEGDTSSGAHVWSNHEEAETWNEWIEAFARLPGFAEDWFARVSQPAFAPSVTVAYERPIS
jgi:hypothetical protein